MPNYRKAGSSDFGATGYWDSALADNQDLRIDSGADDFTSGTNRDGDDFLSVHFERSFGSPSQVSGTSTDPLRFDCNQTGTGTVRLAHNGAEVNIRGGAGGTHNDVEILPGNPSMRVNYGQTTINKLLIEGGNVVVGADCVMPASNDTVIFGGSHRILAHTGGTNVPTIHVYGGQVLLQRDFTALHIYNNAIVTLDLAAGVTGGNIFLRAMPGSGSLVHIKGDVATVHGFSGVYNRSRLSRAAAGTALNRYPLLTEIVERGPARVTFTNTYTFGSGPTQA